MSASLVQETTAFLLEALKNNNKEEGYLQTKLLEINLLGGSPQVLVSWSLSLLVSIEVVPKVVAIMLVAIMLVAVFVSVALIVVLVLSSMLLLLLFFF